MTALPRIRRLGSTDGLVVEGTTQGNAEGAGARVRILDEQRAELLVSPGRGTFSAQVVIDAEAAGALAVELLRLWSWHTSVADLELAAEAVEEARNSGDSTVPHELIDILTEAVRQVVPPAHLAEGTGARDE